MSILKGKSFRVTSSFMQSPLAT